MSLSIAANISQERSDSIGSVHCRVSLRTEEAKEMLQCYVEGLDRIGFELKMRFDIVPAIFLLQFLNAFDAV